MADNDGLWSAIGEGFRGIGAVASPAVAQRQAQERAETLPNMLRALQLKGAQRAFDADTKFSEAVSGLEPTSLKTSADVLGALSKVPLDVIAESPKAQQALKIVGTLQQKEAATEQRKQQMTLAYERLDQQRELAEERARDARASAEERARANLANEQIRRQMAQMQEAARRESLDLRREIFKSRNNPEALLNQDDARFMAEQYLAGDRTVVANLGRGAQGGENVLRFRMAVTKAARDKGMSPQAVAAKIAEFEGIKAGERTLGTRTANIEMAVSEAQQMAPLATQASEAVDRTKYPTLNAAILAAEKGTGDENVVRLGVATNSLINIYSRAISPTGVPTVSDKEHARELLSTAWSKGQFKAGVDQMMKELEQARKSPGIVRKEFKDAVTGDEKKDALKNVTDDGLKAAVEKAGQQYEPEKYDYRVVGGKVQRKAKSGG